MPTLKELPKIQLVTISLMEEDRIRLIQSLEGATNNNSTKHLPIVKRIIRMERKKNKARRKGAEDKPS